MFGSIGRATWSFVSLKVDQRIFIVHSSERDSRLRAPCPPICNRTNAQILFDRFHIVKHLDEAVDAVRRELWRQLTAKERTTFKGTRWLLLKNPWNLTGDQKERLSTLVRLERAHRPRLLPQRSLSTVLVLPAAQAGRRPLGEMDAFGHSLTAGALQEICPHTAWASGWDSELDRSPCLQRRSRRNEQQDQIHQPSLVRVPDCRELHCGDLSLLRPATTTRRALITLLG